MMQATRSVPEWSGVDAATFGQIVARDQPAVLRGACAHWPAVQQARSSPEAICRYLGQFDNGALTDAILVPPQHRGRMFYRDDLGGFNYLRNKLPISTVIEQLARYSHFAEPPSVAVQCAPLDDCLPGFRAANRLELLDPGVAPRIWMGNRFITPAHFDEQNNLACVVAGRRRFTLFPPEQVGNLYIGPLDMTPAGAPISLVDLHAPDLARFPRFAEALVAAQVAELGPGDALFLPAVWWHHVESFDAVNVLVNYWWADSAEASGVSPVKALLHCLMAMQDKSPAHRAAWGKIFAHYAFQADGDPAAHLPPDKRGVLGALSADQVRQVAAALPPVDLA